jgi:dTDP-4-amino-4,6-dideoxygalactose transaminase
MAIIPFNKPYMTGKELHYISDAHSRGKLSGDGYYTQLCSDWMESNFNANKVLLTQSCTAALEMAAILAGIEPGDQVILPSYTFVSSANAFVLRGAVPVFVDIKLHDQNIDENLIEEAITPRTKAIVVVHYAGVACEMDKIMEIARRHGLMVIEDSAQAIFGTYQGKQLGTIGDMGCFSFHETKNVISGEGGALIVNRQSLVERAEIIREKGTDRSRFFRGEIDKYTWRDIGSSFLPSEINAAFLWSQLQDGRNITSRRQKIWYIYHSELSKIIDQNQIQLPKIIENPNAHMFQLIFKDSDERKVFLEELKKYDISSVTHYVPLHSSPAGRRFGRVSSARRGGLPITEFVSSGLLRLPMYPELDLVQEHVIESITRILKA